MKLSILLRLIILLITSCKKEEVIINSELRVELVNHTFEGTMNIGTKFYTDASFSFMRGGVRDPYYLVAINYDEKNGSGLIEILEDNTFIINFKLDEVDYSGTGLMIGESVALFATNTEKSEVGFRGNRTL